jgi:hypothetical protein
VHLWPNARIANEKFSFRSSLVDLSTCLVVNYMVVAVIPVMALVALARLPLKALSFSPKQARK